MLKDANVITDSLRVIAGFTQSKSARLALLNQEWFDQKTVFTWPVPEPLCSTRGQTTTEPELWLQSAWWVHELRSRRVLFCNDLTWLPLDAKADLRRLGNDTLERLCLLAIYDGKRLAAVLQLENPAMERVLSACDLNLIITASSTLLHTMYDPFETGFRSEWERRLGDLNRHFQGGLNTQEVFEQLVDYVIERKGRLFAVLLIEADLTGMKEGEWCAQRHALTHQMVERVRGCLRAADVVLNLTPGMAGAVLVDVFDQTDVLTIVNRIRNALPAPLHGPAKIAGVRFHIGIARPELQTASASELIDAAHKALSEAKFRFEYGVVAVPILQPGR